MAKDPRVAQWWLEKRDPEFKNVIKTVFYLAVMLFAAYLVWCNW